VKIWVINGPNLNLLGRRDPNHYGNMSYPDLVNRIEKHSEEAGFEVHCFQSNHEGEIIDQIHDKADIMDGLIINPGAFTHYSYALRDALEIVEVPIIEVHLSNIYAREDFRKKSVISPLCQGIISGMGIKGYFMALDYFKPV